MEFKYIFLAVFAFIGLGSIRAFIRSYRDVTQSHKWVFANGKVITSEKRSSSGVNGYSESAYIEYEYSVNLTELVGSDVKSGGDISWSISIPGLSNANNLLEKYPVGKEVMVYYDPLDSERSCLEHGSLTPLLIFYVLFYLVFGFVGIVALNDFGYL